jgi:hypothetical protein
MRKSGDGEDHPLATLRQPLMQHSGLIDEAPAQLAQRHHAEAGLVADQDDPPRQLRQHLQQRVALARQQRRILRQ